MIIGNKLYLLFSQAGLRWHYTCPYQSRVQAVQADSPFTPKYFLVCGGGSMGDFYQTGLVATFHRLGQSNLERLENELQRFARQWPIALVLPALYSELESRSFGTPTFYGGTAGGHRSGEQRGSEYASK